ncbi:MAG TPA: hypothetical protein VM577_19160 [Anaerovoracaceae bacterium]|nr:hypothetical protein [Anaerovoracaceae bacterium]
MKSMGEQKAEIRSFLANQYRGKPTFVILSAIQKVKSGIQEQLSQVKKGDKKSLASYELHQAIKVCDELTAELQSSKKNI